MGRFHRNVSRKSWVCMSETTKSQTVFAKVEDLERFRSRAQEEAKSHKARVLICMTGCRSMGAIEVAQAFREKVTACGLGEEVEIVDVGCHGQCVLAPAIVIERI